MAPLPPRRPEEYSQQSGLPDIQYGYANEIFPHIQQAISGLLGSSQPQQGITPDQQAQNNQIWDRLGRGASASPMTMGPPAPMPQPSPQMQPHIPQMMFPQGWQNKQLAGLPQPSFGRLIPMSQAGLSQPAINPGIAQLLRYRQGMA